VDPNGNGPILDDSGLLSDPPDVRAIELIVVATLGLAREPIYSAPPAQTTADERAHELWESLAAGIRSEDLRRVIPCLQEAARCPVLAESTVLPALRERAKDARWELRYWAARALAALDKAAMPEIVTLLDDSDARVRPMAAESIENALYDLEYLGKPTRAATLGDQFAVFQRRAAALLESTPKLLARIRNGDPHARNALAQAL